MHLSLAQIGSDELNKSIYLFPGGWAYRVEAFTLVPFASMCFPLSPGSGILGFVCIRKHSLDPGASGGLQSHQGCLSGNWKHLEQGFAGLQANPKAWPPKDKEKQVTNILTTHDFTIT